MARYPYHTNPAQMRRLLESLPKIGVPAVVDDACLKTLGVTGSTSNIYRMLTALGLIDAARQPSPRWIRYRDTRQSRHARVA